MRVADPADISRRLRAEAPRLSAAELGPPPPHLPTIGEVGEVVSDLLKVTSFFLKGGRVGRGRAGGRRLGAGASLAGYRGGRRRGVLGDVLDHVGGRPRDVGLPRRRRLLHRLPLRVLRKPGRGSGRGPGAGPGAGSRGPGREPGAGPAGRRGSGAGSRGPDVYICIRFMCVYVLWSMCLYALSAYLLYVFICVMSIGFIVVYVYISICLYVYDYIR